MDATENSIVLRTGKFRESDLWVKMLTASHGMVTAFAFGASKSRRRFTGCLDSYNFIISRVASSKNGEFLNLQEASLLESYTNIRVDWKKQGLVANCIRFLEALGVSQIDADKVFSLTKSLLLYINEASTVHPMIPLLYRYRMAMEYGYALEVTCCNKCGCRFTEGAFFLVTDGLCVCKSCKVQGVMSHYASLECLDILHGIKEFSPEYWGQYNPSATVWRETGRIIDALVRYHLGLEWTGGNFKRN